MVNIVPPMNPAQLCSTQPQRARTSANATRSCSHISSRIARLACSYTWSSTTLYISEIPGGDRPKTCASSIFRSRPASLRSRSRNASSPWKAWLLRDRKIGGMPSNPRNSAIASRSKRKDARSSSSVKEFALRPGLAGGACGLHHSIISSTAASHSRASSSK
eukprot:scaffold471_cov372-Pavlova_lutheri.AAC.5